MHYTARTEGLRAPGEQHAADGWSCARSSGGGRGASGGIGTAVWASWSIPGTVIYRKKHQKGRQNIIILEVMNLRLMMVNAILDSCNSRLPPET